MEKLIFSDNKMFIVEKLLYQNEQTNTKIFSVKDSKLSRQVIIKQIVYENDLQKKQILKEINNQIVLESYTEHIPFIHNVFINEKQKIIALEMSLIKGRSLRDIISETSYPLKDPVIYKEFLKYYVWICETMSRIHKVRNFVHKDIKPENIIINSQRNSAYVIDFGISGPGLSKEIGTYEYMAPEQRKNVDRYHVCQSTDVYALGLVGIELFTGSVLQYGKDLKFDSIGENWKNIDSLNIEKIGGSVLPLLGGILKKAISMDPKDRYQNAISLFSATKLLRVKK